MTKNYISTRDSQNKVSASQAIVQGLASDGGLFVPEFIDEVSFDLSDLAGLSYPQLAEEILGAFLGDFSREQVAECVESAYKSGVFDTEDLVRLTEGPGTYFLELWHGPTAAFKDMALTMLARLVKAAQENIGEKRKVVVLTATSGDTGKAALEGFKDVEGTDVVVFYPKEGVSAAQELQMLTTEGDNTHVIGVEGNFDDAQNGVKAIFNDADFGRELLENDYILSSANSINIGRLLPQIVYYYYSYLRLAEKGVIDLGDPVDFVVPTGNFGDILAGYYAKLTGLPVGRLICASNKNNVLTDFFQTGIYDLKDRPFHKTSSPSMDILISSNLERLLFDKEGRDSGKVADMMASLAKEGSFSTDVKNYEDFGCGCAQELDVFETIKNVFEEKSVLIDPHTAVAQSVAHRKFSDGEAPVIVLSTANPFKFPKSVYTAIYGLPEEGLSEFDVQELLSEKTGQPIPAPLRGLEDRPVRHHKVVEPGRMPAAVLESLGVENAKQ